MKLNINDIIGFLIFHILFIKLPYFDFYTNKVLPILTLFCFFYCIINIKKWLNKKYSKINSIFLIFIVSMTISSLLNPNTFRGFLFILKFFIGFTFFEIVASKKRIHNIVHEFYILFLIYMLISDSLVIFKPSLFNNYKEYFIGNKFYLVYHNILTLLFLSINNNHKKNNLFNHIFFIIISIISIYISIKVDCITGLLGIIMTIFLIEIFDFFKRNLFNAKIIFIIMFFSCSLLLLFSQILKVEQVSNFIINVLHGDVTLTGRTYIYEHVFEIIKSKILLGYGYGNGYETMYNAIKAPNTQNALLECILNFGVIGLGIMLHLFYKIINNFYVNSKKKNVLIIYIIVFSILGMVEITIDLKFLSIIAIINAYSLIEKGEDYEKG